MTFRPRSNLVWASVSFVLIMLFAVNSFTVATNLLQTISELVICFFLSALVYLLWLKPKLVLQEKVIQVVNPLGTELIPYQDVIELETKWALTIIHSRGRTRVWVAPTSGKRRWISNTTFGWSGTNMPLTKSKEMGSENMSASLESFSGQAAYLIRERIKRIH
jgi:hypothetical protein